MNVDAAIATQTEPARQRAAIDEPTTLFGYARREMDRADGNLEEARAALTALLRENDGVLAIVIDDVLKTASMSVTGAVMRGERAAIVRAASGATPAAVASLAKGVTASLFNFPLAGGLRLGNATRQEVEDQAALYEKFAADQAMKARWLRSVAALVPDGKIVQEAVDETVLQTLFTNAAGG